MNIKTAELIAKNPEEHKGSDRLDAFHWADKKRFDKQVSEEFRNRATEVFRTLLQWSLNRSKVQKYVAG